MNWFTELRLCFTLARYVIADFSCWGSWYYGWLLYSCMKCMPVFSSFLALEIITIAQSFFMFKSLYSHLAWMCFNYLYRTDCMHETCFISCLKLSDLVCFTAKCKNSGWPWWDFKNHGFCEFPLFLPRLLVWFKKNCFSHF